MEALAALVPSIGVGLLFWWAIRAVISADRNERKAMAELDRREREQAAAGDDAARPAGAAAPAGRSPATTDDAGPAPDRQ